MNSDFDVIKYGLLENDNYHQSAFLCRKLSQLSGLKEDIKSLDFSVN